MRNVYGLRARRTGYIDAAIKRDRGGWSRGDGAAPSDFPAPGYTTSSAGPPVSGSIKAGWLGRCLQQGARPSHRAMGWVLAACWRKTQAAGSWAKPPPAVNRGLAWQQGRLGRLTRQGQDHNVR